MTSPFLIVENLTVTYPSVDGTGEANVVLDGLSLEVQAGETLAVVGPSGSGKSTLLRAIAGLEPAVSGRIVVDGRDLSGVPSHRRGVGFMFQDNALFRHRTVADNIAYGLEMQGQSVSTRSARVNDLLEMIGLVGYGERSVDQLSGGEGQRVALARALAPSPGLLLLDEPLGSLDRVLRDQLVMELNRWLNEVGQTSLHVTHDQAEAAAVADRIAVLRNGTIVRLGTASELWTDPRLRFVAEFVGHPNIWTSGLEGPGTSLVVPPNAISVIDDPSEADLTASNTVRFRLRVNRKQFDRGRYIIEGAVEGAVEGDVPVLERRGIQIPSIMTFYTDEVGFGGDGLRNDAGRDGPAEIVVVEVDLDLAIWVEE